MHIRSFITNFKEIVFIIHRYSSVSSSTPIWLDNISCVSSYRTLSNCRNSRSTNACDHSKDIAISCSNGEQENIKN